MKTRAAVALEKAKPLEIIEVDLEGPKAGEVLVEVKATGICHTDEFTLSGADPEGLFPAILGHEGAGIVVDIGPGVKREEGRSCHPALHAGMPRVPLLPLAQDQSVHRHPRHPGTGRDAGRHLALLPQRQEAAPLHGHLDVLEFHGAARDRRRQSARGRAFDKICYIGCGVTTGIGAVLNTAKVEPGAKAIVFGLGGIGLNVIQGLRLAGANMIIGVDINNARKEWGERFGMTHFVNPNEVNGDLVAHLVNMTKRGADQIGGADYTFECTGNVKVMRVALEACHRGWGQSIIIGVAGAGQEIATRPFQLVTGRVWKGTAFGGARGRTDVPKIVDWYMDGKIEIDPMITHTMPLPDINKGFDLMHEGKSIRSVVIY